MVLNKDIPHPRDKGVACILLMAYMKSKKQEINQRGYCQQKDLGPENSESAQLVCIGENERICL